MTQTTPSTSDRRPIATRDLAISHRLAAALARMNITANAISVAGMICGIAAGAALAGTYWTDGVLARLLWLAGAGLVQLRLLANMLDGMVALRTGTASPVGELYNEVPDRISDSFILIGLGYAAGGSPVLGWLSALLAALTAYVRALGKGAGAASDFCGPMAKPQRMFLVTAGAVFMTFSPVAWTGWHPATWTLAVIAFGSAITALRRLMHIAGRLRSAA